jgi:hypothetical protein
MCTNITWFLRKSIVQGLVLVFLPGLVPTEVRGQSAADTTVRRSTIKLDITSYWLYRNAIVFSYERIPKNKPYQSWAITGGFQQFPTLLGTYSDSIMVTKDLSASGFKLGAEYRFYLQKENKYRAPHGVYIGSYTSFHNYMNRRALEINNDGVPEYAELETNLNILNLGVQLGYQFVLNDRWTIDLTFIGPSVSNYSANLRWDGNFTFDPDDITNEVILALMDRFPAFDELINEGEFSSSGKTNTWAYGYRYQFLIGYHFGRRKGK